MKTKQINILLIAFALLTLLVCNLKAQVTNGSFEQGPCPDLISTLPDSWYNTRNDIDLISGCGINGQTDYSNAGSPLNWFGYQQAQDGSNYIAICMGAEQPEVREWPKTDIDPLIKDSIYRVSFYISRADRYNLAVNSIGVYFGALPYQNPYFVDYSQIDYSKIATFWHMVIDTVAWERIELYYIAQGGENSLTIGNFYPDNLCKYEQLGNGNAEFNYAYYYIDNITIDRMQANTLPEQYTKPKQVLYTCNYMGQIGQPGITVYTNGTYKKQ